MTVSTPEQTTSARTTLPQRQRGRGELLVDVLLVIGIAYYVWVAHSYPADGRQIPMVVGTVALVAAVVQLIGWFVPGMWKLTHGDSAQKSDGHPAVAHIPLADATDPEPAVAEAVVSHVPAAPEHRAIDVPVAMAWAAGFVGAILVVGFDIAVPVFFVAYFGSRRSWKLAIASAVVMGLITHFLFETALGIPLPGGLLF